MATTSHEPIYVDKPCESHRTRLMFYWLESAESKLKNYIKYDTQMTTYLKLKYFLNTYLYLERMVQTKKVTLSMDIEIDIPKDIVLDKKRLKKVQEGILKVISKGPYEEGLLFKITRAQFEIEPDLSENKPESG